MIEEKNVRVNYPSTAFFTMSKKNYLYYVLHQKNVPAPKTVVIASEKAARNIEKNLELPILAKKIEEMEQTEENKLETQEEIGNFVDGVEYEEDVIVLHEYIEGDKYKCLVIEDEVISLKDDSDGWKFDENSLKYSNPSENKIEIVKKAARNIGAPIAEVVLRGEKVYDVNPNPDLEMYTNQAGKDMYETAAKALKGEEE